MWVKSGCTWLPRALCGSSVPSNLAHCQAAGPGGGVIPKGTLKKSCRSLNCICLYHFGREVGGNSREQFFKEKSHSWIGLPEKHLFFFFFGLLWAFQESQACAKKQAARQNSVLMCEARENLGVWLGGGWYWNVPVHLLMSGQQKIVTQKWKVRKRLRSKTWTSIVFEKEMLD